ncbi:hypothetical protein [Rubrimonas cliftonensis]|uniref:Uncharacterized protein n=1 Tax=Rubrimonas cliftonensis TaxID=89524 RepID=A0A1H4FC12_9RHOB|nr:hypothetical protein [Rubrimonas cliftonensis]SEA94577.1 hypothetical protein SAMN05444370_12043 [Rubrimonas cliftonensis]
MGRAGPIFPVGVLDKDGGRIRDPAVPDLPHFGEVHEMVDGQARSGAAGEVRMSFFAAGFGAQKLLSLPAATPADIGAAHDEALTSAGSDPEHLARRAEALGPREQVLGPAAERMKAVATAIDGASRAAAAAWLKARFDVEAN